MISAGANGVSLGSNGHIAAAAHVFGDGRRVTSEDSTGISSHMAISSAADDYSSVTMSNPTVPARYTKIGKGPVVLRKPALIGLGSAVMLNVELAEGSAVGALTFVSTSVPAFCNVSGNPTRRVSNRKRTMLQLEREYDAAGAGDGPSREAPC
jgi:acetyltransferase-like isoleucine patch superfamily enzyme